MIPGEEQKEYNPCVSWNSPFTCMYIAELTLVFQVLLSVREEVRENNECEDKERHGTPDAQSEHSALSLPLFTVSHLLSSQGHVRPSLLAHKDERHVVRDYARPRRR